MSLLIAFSGQGLQHANMFKTLANDEYGKLWLDEAAQLLNLNLFDSEVIQHYCNDVIYAQLFLVILGAGSYCAINKHISLRPQFLCGYSLGELSAFSVSAGLSLKDLCSVTYKRAELMQLAASKNGPEKTFGLAALKGNINQNTAQLLSEQFECPIAIINASDHFILGGRSTNLDALLNEAKSIGISRAQRLAVNLPSHTPLLKQATGEFFTFLQNFQQHTMKLPILNALNNEVIHNSTEMIVILANELSQTLHWNKVMQMAPEYGTNFFLELGAGSSLKKMFTAENPQIKAYSLEDFASISGLSQFIKNTTQSTP